jgi:hypothetical protein
LVRVQISVRLAIGVIAFCATLVGPGARGQNSASPAASQPSPRAEELETLLDRLGDESYIQRADATQNLFARGPAIVPRLRERLLQETDAEVQHRLRYLLENIAPPRQAALLVRATPESDLNPGDVITHANARRVRNQSELRQRLANSSRGMSLRVRTPSGPREVSSVEIQQLIELSDYVAPRGEALAQAVRLYAAGFAEQAYETLRQLSGPIPPDELSEELRARIAYTAGDRTRALELMAGHTEAIGVSGPLDWSSPSHFDLRGPGKAPFHLEWVVATRAGRDVYANDADPDLRIQRILLPAHRYADALEHTVGYWWREFRDRLGSPDGNTTIAGNQLAVAAWMLQGMDLRSECCRLIEPRSVVLRQAPRGIRKWIRVETDAWLPFLAGDTQAALDGFFDDALDVLRRPPRPTDTNALPRNPRVAARVAFFVYQALDEQRIEKGLGAVSHHTHPALAEYLDWMLYALTEKNHETIRRDLHSLLPHIPDGWVLPYARAVALLEYVRNKPDPDVLQTARQRLASSPAGEQREVWLAIVDALIQLLQERPEEAIGVLAPFRARSETSVLWHTARFLSDPPASAANHAALRQPALVVPVGQRERVWLVLARDRRLMLFDATASLLSALDRPTPTWFPNPLTWPWIGRESDATGRAWVYCRRRVVEIDPAERGGGLRLNLRTDEIPAFDRYVGPRFSRFADAVAAVTLQPGENSEFLRSEIKAHGEFWADPDLREIGMIQALPQAERVIHVALRGGPHMLIDTDTGRSWTSLWIRDQLELPAVPEFFAEALWQPEPDNPPVALLMSDQGLIRFDLGAERLTRIPLPGSEPYPPLVPESTPYQRRDPRFAYCARLPQDGGRVYRILLADGTATEVDMINEALPAQYYRVRLRAEIRRELDGRLEKANLPTLETFIADATETVTHGPRQEAQEQDEP